MSLADVLARKKPVTRSVEVFLDTSVAESVQRAQERLERAQRAQRRPDDLAAQVEVDEATEALEAERQRVRDEGAVATFTFAGLGRKPFEALVEAHPATDEQQTQARSEALAAGLRADQARLRWNSDTFGPALVAVAAVDPPMTLAEAEQIFAEWNDAECSALYIAALEAQQTRPTASLGEARPGSAATRG